MGCPNTSRISLSGLVVFFFRRGAVRLPEILLAGLLLFPFPLSAEPTQPLSPPPSVALIVSRNIKPYVEAVEGFLTGMRESANGQISTFFLENHGGKSNAALAEKIGGQTFSLVVTIGPEATRLAHEARNDLSPRFLYSMVLNPENILEPDTGDCGVPLNIPVSAQLEEIASHLPKIKRIGLLFDPANNEAFYKNARKAASARGIEIVPLRAGSRSEIPEALQKGQTLDALWMIPDRTIISESIVEYIIKEMILRKIPTIGYNRFFYDSGAVMAFAFDYRALGAQTAALAESALTGTLCPYAPPLFSTLVNHRVLQRLGLDSNLDSDLDSGSKSGSEGSSGS